MSFDSQTLSLGHVLIIDDCPHLTQQLQAITEPKAQSVTVCASIDEARKALQICTPHVVLLDYRLPDGTALDLLDDLNALRPKPIILGLSGTASPGETFRLARGGVSRFLTKPFGSDDLFRELHQAFTTPPDIKPQLSDLVGHVSIKQAERMVRTTMVDEALAKSDGSMRGASRLLGISRQMLQQVMRLRRTVDDGLTQ